MKVEGVQCDVCAQMRSTQTAYIPQGWFTLIPHNGGMAEEELHFCSAGHLRDWVEKKLEEEERVKQ